MNTTFDIATITTTSDQRVNNNNNSLSNTTSNNISNNTSNTSNNNNNWVRNYSKTPLTDAQHLLSHGPNFVITPRDPPTLEYIATSEKVCNQLTQGKGGRA